MPLTARTALRKDRSNVAPVSMQHRHFAFIAGLIANSGERTKDKRRIADMLAVGLAKTNPNFDRARFFSAVGVDDPHVTSAAYPDENPFHPESPEGRAWDNGDRSSVT